MYVVVSGHDPKFPGLSMLISQGGPLPDGFAAVAVVAITTTAMDAVKVVAEATAAARA